MKQFLTFFVLFVFSYSIHASEVIEIDVHGMTCSFCSNGLHRSLNKLPEINSVKVSLKHKKVQVVSDSQNIDIEQIKQAIIDSGFTPGPIYRNINVD